MTAPIKSNGRISPPRFVRRRRGRWLELASGQSCEIGGARRFVVFTVSENEWGLAPLNAFYGRFWVELERIPERNSEQGVSLPGACLDCAIWRWPPGAYPYLPGFGREGGTKYYLVLTASTALSTGSPAAIQASKPPATSSTL